MPKQIETKKAKRQWQTIGEVCVDTGTIVICDPCQANETTEWCYDGMDLQNDSGAAELNDDGGIPIAVALTTGIGDGRYKVEARYVETDSIFGKRIAEIRIKFLPHPYFESE
jgi:hypothetical protein